MQDIWDDSNSTPLFEESMEDGTAYIYTSTSLHITADKNNEGPIPIWKINAATGEIVWQSDSYECHTVSGRVGAAWKRQACWARTISLTSWSTRWRARRDVGSGVLVALSKETGKEVLAVSRWIITRGVRLWPCIRLRASHISFSVTTDGNIFLLEGHDWQAAPYAAHQRGGLHHRGIARGVQ